MATKKVTITLDDEQLRAIEKLIASGSAESVSGFIRHAVTVALGDVAGWGAMLADALARTGGPLTKKERAWADSLLKPRPSARHRRKAA